MNRKTKYRAWDHVDEIMVYSDQENDNHYFSIETFAKAYRIYDSIGDEGQPEPASEEIELMEYTGLKDSSEKEIYEGDILKFYYGNNSPGPRVWEVIYENDRAMFRAKLTSGDRHLKSFFKAVAEVIGNIYENPELS